MTWQLGPSKFLRTWSDRWQGEVLQAYRSADKLLRPTFRDKTRQLRKYLATFVAKRRLAYYSVNPVTLSDLTCIAFCMKKGISKQVFLLGLQKSDRWKWDVSKQGNERSERTCRPLTFFCWRRRFWVVYLVRASWLLGWLIAGWV